MKRQTPEHPGEDEKDKEPREQKERRTESLTDEQRRSPPGEGRAGATEAAPTPGRDVAAGRAAATTAAAAPPEPDVRGFGNLRGAVVFLGPAAFLLLVLLVYPTVFTAWRSFYGPQAAGADFVGFDNYVRMFTEGNVFTALKNNFYWVVLAPTAVTAIGLVFAVLLERVRFQTAFKTVIFMPMAISFLAVGIIFRLVYQSQPDVGLASALVQSVAHIFDPPGPYPGANPSVPERIIVTDDGAFVVDEPFSTGATATVGLVGIPPRELPEEAVDADRPPPAGDSEITGTVWFDFSPQGERGSIDPGELGLPGVEVEVVGDAGVAATAVSEDDGTFTATGLAPGTYAVRLAASNFDPPFGGVNWLSEELFLGASVATWSIISAFIWMWAGFAMVLIAAGLAAIPREVMESARVDGASEWQVFRRIMVPLLAPVLLVVLVTLMINVLKIFDLVLIMAPGPVQDDATVLALEMWRVSFGGARDFGLGSAITVVLFLLVIPAMLFNIRRFRQEGG